MNIVYENGPGGACPVQAEGTINGYPFYFRSRHEHWSIRIASDKDKDPYDDDAWYFIEEYPLKEGEEYPTVAAGHATKEECIEFIEKAAKKYLDINNS